MGEVKTRGGSNASRNNSTAGTATNGDLRRTAQKSFVQQLQKKLEAIKGNEDRLGVFVVPVFDDNGKNSNTVVRKTVSDATTYVMLMSVSGEMEYNPARKRFEQYVRSALVFAPAGYLENKFKSGDELGGRIVTKYSTKGNENDKMVGLGTDIVCVNEDGEDLYRTVTWVPELTDKKRKQMTAEQIEAYEDSMIDDEVPVIANIEEINAARAIAKAADAGKNIGRR